MLVLSDQRVVRALEIRVDPECRDGYTRGKLVTERDAGEGAIGDDRDVGGASDS